MAKLRDYLQLVRLPGVFTAQADILAGVLAAGAGRGHLREIILLLCASSAFFSAGMALNDYFDAEIDGRERPLRPIPSGRIKPRAALFSGAVLLMSGTAAAALCSGTALATALLLVLAILSYNGRVKKYRLAGPINMALCRYLNFLLGLSSMPFSPQLWSIPLMNALYIFGITRLSAHEVKGRNTAAAVWMLLCIAAAAFWYGILARIEVLPHKAGIFFCLVWMAAAFRHPLRLFFHTGPEDYQRAVKGLLLLLIALDGAVAAGAGSIFGAAAIWLLFVPAVFIGAKLYVT